jgi:hypothetical protein
LRVIQDRLGCRPGAFFGPRSPVAGYAALGHHPISPTNSTSASVTNSIAGAGTCS